MMTTTWPIAPVRSLVHPTVFWYPATMPRTHIQYVDVSAVSRERLAITAAERVPADKASSRARKIVHTGDTLFATIRPGLARIAQVPSDLDGEIASTAFCVLRPNRERVLPDFLFYAAANRPFVERVADLQTGASYPAVRDSDVLEQTIPVPPLPVQGDIVAVMNCVRRALLLEFELSTTSENLKHAAMRDLFTRGLRGEPQRESEFGAAPEGWRIANLSDVATVQTGVAKGRALGDAEVVDVPYLRVANVQDGHLDLREMKRITIRTSEIDRYRLEPGDVVLTEGGDFDKLGRGFVWNGEVPGCVHQNHVFAVRTDRKVLEPTFLAYLAQSPCGKAYFLKVAHKTTNLACINTTKLKALPVLIPALSEQQEIVAILDAIDRKIDLHRRKKAVLEELFKSLLHKLMTGEIRVADLDLSALSGFEEARS